MISKLAYEQINRRNRAARPDARHPLSIMLEDVRSAYNVGAVFRTADAAYLERVYCTGITPPPTHRSVAKTALGAQDSVPWRRVSRASGAVSMLKSSGHTVVALEQTNRPTAWEKIADNHFPMCLVVGNEVNGVSEDLLQMCDLALEIPQFGAKQSLNVAVAAGIAVFKLLDRYREVSDR